MKKYFSVGNNMPGYMPDNEATIVPYISQAKAILIEDIENHIESLCEDTDVTSLENTLAEFKAAKAQPCNVYIADRVYWIEEIDASDSNRAFYLSLNSERM